MLPPALIPVLAAAIRFASPDVPLERATRYATDYAAVASDIDEGFALVSTARVEGVFDPRVETCARTGDHGRSVSMFQLRRHWWGGHTRAEVCRSNRLAAWLALRALRAMGFERAPDEAFRRYVGCSARDRRVSFRVNLWRTLRKVA